LQLLDLCDLNLDLGSGHVAFCHHSSITTDTTFNPNWINLFVVG